MAFSFFSKLIEIFKNLFKKEPVVIRTVVEDVPALVEKEFLLKRAALEDFAAKKISETKYLHSKAQGYLKIISEKELEGKSNERLNKAALTSKKQLENQLSKLLAKLNPSERGNNLSDARKYSGEAYALLGEEIVALRRNIAYTSFYLKEEMRVLGESLQELANIFHELNTEFAKNADLFGFEKLKEKVKFVSEKKNELKKLEEKLEGLGADVKNAENRHFMQSKTIQEKKTGNEMDAVLKLEEEVALLASEKQELKTEISALLLNIDRPLQRFKQLVDSSRWRIPHEEKEVLDLFITNPMFGLKKDPKADVFKRVLVQVVKAVEEGAIELKDKEKEKRLSALQEIINFDFFGKVFWKMNEIQRKQDTLNKALEGNKAKKNLIDEEKKLGEIEESANETKETISQIEEKISAQKREINNYLNEIKLFAQKCLKKTVLLEEEMY